MGKTEKWIEEEKKYMYHELNKIKELKVYKTDTNFILLKSLGLNAKILRDKMLERGILIRDASNFTYLDDRFVRLAIKDRKNKHYGSSLPHRQLRNVKISLSIILKCSLPHRQLRKR